MRNCPLFSVYIVAFFVLLSHDITLFWMRLAARNHSCMDK